VATAVGTHVGPWSDEDLLGLPEDAQRYELLELTLLVNPLPGGVHQRITFRLTSLLDAAALHDLVVVEAMGVRLPDNTVFIPDILVATRDVVLANDSGILDAGTVALVARSCLQGLGPPIASPSQPCPPAPASTRSGASNQKTAAPYWFCPETPVEPPARRHRPTLLLSPGPRAFRDAEWCCGAGVGTEGALEGLTCMG
jgi:hypothetical protein